MAKAKNRAEWNQTSHVLAVLINANRDPKKGRPVKPAELNPYAKVADKKDKSTRFISIEEFAKILGSKKIKKVGSG